MKKRIIIDCDILPEDVESFTESLHTFLADLGKYNEDGKNSDISVWVTPYIDIDSMLKIK